MLLLLGQPPVFCKYELPLQVLAPWARVFPASSFQAMLLRCIMPKLVSAMRQLKIDPRNQVH